MGTGYTIDTPIKVAHYGISSVISIIDHRLTEQMREYYSGKYNLQYQKIDESEPDSRAKKITAYLNLVQQIVEQNFTELKQSEFVPGSEITKYFDLLPDQSPLKLAYHEMEKLDGEQKKEAQRKLRDQIVPGSIDVNIMTKLDGKGTNKKESEQDSIFNDAHAALRGFARSNLSSSVVFSAGLNPRLYSYAASFKDFFPDENGFIKKKVVLKVSDYRSALIQGKFLAKKGIWVSEYRIESGLNCGGHAFATDGFLMGPILEEFNQNKVGLKDALIPLMQSALEENGINTDFGKLNFTLSVQGGVGSAMEHEYLYTNKAVDSVGWGSPFLLVPEAVTIDEDTLQLLSKAKEEDYYLSEVSPLGVSFNTVRGNSAEQERNARIEAGKPGAPCVKKHLALNTEVSENPLCTASVKYQKKKIDELMLQNLPEQDFKVAFKSIVEKVCLCVGLGNGAAIDKGYELKKGTHGVAICPGPNTAYFKKVVSLKEMVDHIYGRTNLVTMMNRPNMFIKELQLYVQYIKRKMEQNFEEQSTKQQRYIQKFLKNLNAGIEYYEVLFNEASAQFGEVSEKAKKELDKIKRDLSVYELAVS
ncbi:MAG: hypothetical protein MI700_11465 [Balneolales bacterium]|nr:hypothetical protein [Balneolales bacterium]